jgi:hypothetical protein
MVNLLGSYYAYAGHHTVTVLYTLGNSWERRVDMGGQGLGVDFVGLCIICIMTRSRAGRRRLRKDSRFRNIIV